MAQENLFTEKSENLDKGPVICLGKKFHSEEERRAYYRNELRTKLPELKEIEGFPIGEDEDIINLSDPPYYTACPNPWLNDFIVEWEKEKENIPGRKKDFNVDEPYASDISEGKNNPIYNAHSYHTKVPHPAIMRYILHYTQPGDIIFDGFAGTGMTAVASNYCSHPDAETKYKIEKEWIAIHGLGKPTWGVRKSINSDLSPIASFIEANYNMPIENDIHVISNKIIANAFEKYQWLYETNHQNEKKGIINSTIWSEVFLCSNCNSEIVFWDAAVDINLGKVSDEFACNNCKVVHTKSSVERAFETVFDNRINRSRRISKFYPVLISYTYQGKKYDKKPDANDLNIIEMAKNEKDSVIYPNYEIIDGDEIGRVKNNGFDFLGDLFFDRTLVVLNYLFELSKEYDSKNFRLYLTSIIQRASKLFRWSSNQAGPLMGTYYIASSIFEISVFNLLKNKNKLITSISDIAKNKDTLIYCGSCTQANFINSNSVDYIFTDPPFGANLMYSELNFIWESWLKVRTNNKEEAIENKTQGKSTLDYQELMTRCFNEYFRVLKPGKWMTVEFSNTGAAVWNGIQTGLQRAGFVIANVAGLDKKQGSFKAVTTPTAVKQDLVISCYKPSAEFESKFKTLSGDLAVWDFVSEHLHHLPAHIGKENSTTSIVERSPKIIFDRLITFYLMRGLPVPIDARDFQEGLKQKFVERDGMYFTAEQAA